MRGAAAIGVVLGHGDAEGGAPGGEGSSGPIELGEGGAARSGGASGSMAHGIASPGPEVGSKAPSGPRAAFPLGRPDGTAHRVSHPRSLAALLALTSIACGGAASTPSGTGGAASSSTTGTAGMGGGTSSASTSATSTSGGAGGAGGAATSTSSGTGGTGGGPMDACAGTMPACPNNPPATAGQGLVPIDPCAFPLVDQNTWSAKMAVADALGAALPHASVADVLADLNRTAVAVTAAQVPGSAAGFVKGFRWNDGDEAVAYWIPQGITSSRDGTDNGTVGGHEIVLVSWYYDIASDPGATVEKGVRIAFVDAGASPPAYRFALLVDPIAGATPSFAAVNIHAGGIVWSGDYLYVADTSKGLRVFDLGRMLRVNTTQDGMGWDPATGAYHAAGYKYVVPQVGRYVHASACAPIFSFVGLDRSSTPPSLISGEYCNGTTACATGLSGRVFRWPLDAATHRLAAATTYPVEAAYMGQRQVQGAAAHAGTYYLSSSAPAGSAGALYVIPKGAGAKTLGWVDSPEDLVYDTMNDRLWGLSEAAGARFVLAVSAPP